jgi:D-galactarolactone cycloisomerase
VCEDGTTGWGACFGPAALNAAVVGAFRPHLIGADALACERIWMRLHRAFRDQVQRGLVRTAVSGVDVALSDVKGKHFRAPARCSALRSKVRAYATGTCRGSAAGRDYIVEKAAAHAREGFAAVKIKAASTCAPMPTRSGLAERPRSRRPDALCQAAPAMRGAGPRRCSRAPRAPCMVAPA